MFVFTPMGGKSQTAGDQRDTCLMMSDYITSEPGLW